MKTRYIVILFLIVAAGLGLAFYLTKNQPEENEKIISHSKIVVPKNTTADGEEEEEEFDLSVARSYIDLLPTETLISSLLVDINNDTYEDEVDIIRTAGSEFFQILPALFNKETSNYDRMDLIPTNISRAGSVTLQGLDVIGNHTNAIIFQGIDDDNNSVMQIYQYRVEDSVQFMKLIGDFSSDVMVFIQQIDRNEAYDFDESDGASYTVWIYKINPEDPESNPGQLQQEYVYNHLQDKYELSKEIKIPASRLAAKELSRIQDGSLEVYGEFLTGLWVKGTGKAKKSLYFDFAKREIIQFSGDIQEVYEWGTSRVRHNGVYIYSANTIISNLHRRIDVSLVNIDEVRLIIRDDVNLNIEADNAWDGYYKKMEVSDYVEPVVETALDKIRNEIEKGPAWTSVDTLTTITLEDHSFTMESTVGIEKGLYSFLSSGTSNIIQFRSFSENSNITGNYEINFGQKTVTNRRGVESLVEDTDSIILTPVLIYASGTEPLIAKEQYYTRKIDEEE